MPGEFLDTNVLLYAFTNDQRSARAQEVLGRGCTIAVQTLNEFTNVARRKLGMGWEDIHEALSSIRILCPTITTMTLEVHHEALALAERYGFHMFDALVVASAKLSGCNVLWSEDMHNGLTVDGQLRIVNPFRLP